VEHSVQPLSLSYNSVQGIFAEKIIAKAIKNLEHEHSEVMLGHSQIMGCLAMDFPISAPSLLRKIGTGEQFGPQCSCAALYTLPVLKALYTRSPAAFTTTSAWV